MSKMGIPISSSLWPWWSSSFSRAVRNGFILDKSYPAGTQSEVEWIISEKKGSVQTYTHTCGVGGVLAFAVQFRITIQRSGHHKQRKRERMILTGNKNYLRFSLIRRRRQTRIMIMQTMTKRIITATAMAAKMRSVWSESFRIQLPVRRKFSF